MDWFHATRMLEYWFVIVPALLSLAVFARWWIDRRAAARIEQELLRFCQGSRAQAENLIVVELASHPGITRAIALESLISRLRESPR